jgi:tetratricopeptide (TPR) repeat protein
VISTAGSPFTHAVCLKPVGKASPRQEGFSEGPPLDTQTRRALKQDRFVEATAFGLDWVQLHRSNVIKVTIAAVVLIALIVTGVFVYSSRSASAEIAFGKAMDIYNTPLLPPGQPPIPGEPTYKTAAERAKAANPIFVDVANRYGWLKAGANARYFAGLTYLDIGQTAPAEAALQKAADSHDSALGALAKMALADLYRQTGRNSQAVDIYQQLIKNPANTVPASAAKLQLAQLYETTNPTEAKKLYAEIKDQDKNTAAGQIAAQKLAGAKGPLQ